MAQINKPNEHFNTVLFTGNGSTQSITGVNFQPDFTWIKNRTGFTNALFDIVRGVAYRLRTDSTSAESTTLPDSVTSFDSDGFSLDADPAVNNNGNNIVSWNWLASNTMHQTQMVLLLLLFQLIQQVDLVLLHTQVMALLVQRLVMD